MGKEECIRKCLESFLKSDYGSFLGNSSYSLTRHLQVLHVNWQLGSDNSIQDKNAHKLKMILKVTLSPYKIVDCHREH